MPAPPQAGLLGVATETIAATGFVLAAAVRERVLLAATFAQLLTCFDPGVGDEDKDLD